MNSTLVILALYSIFQFLTPFEISSNDAVSRHDFKTSPTTIVYQSHNQKHTKKKWTFIVYLAADNDLYSFAGRNIKQMQLIGSNNFINILVHLDIHLAGQKKVTKRFYVEKTRLIQVAPDAQMDSGDPQSLVDCFKWAYTDYPADEYAIDLWNHGTGILDPTIPRTINPSELFFFNASSKIIELDRRIGFIDYVDSMVNQPRDERGICFDETTGNYLTNKKLMTAFEEIYGILGRKLSILFFDACLMQMWEVGRIFEPYVNLIVGSQEVELGTGYDYSLALAPFASGPLTPHDFACNVVSAFEKTYGKITHDYTQSAVNLDFIQGLTKNINDVAERLIDGLSKQRNGSFKEIIRISRNKLYCTQFDEPSYIDLHHFYANIIANIDKCELRSKQETDTFKASLKLLATQGCTLINQLVIAHCAGKNLKNASGISIYFPERRIHPSYYHAPGSLNNQWLQFLSKYLGI